MELPLKLSLNVKSALAAEAVARMRQDASKAVFIRRMKQFPSVEKFAEDNKPEAYNAAQIEQTSKAEMLCGRLAMRRFDAASGDYSC